MKFKFFKKFFLATTVVTLISITLITVLLCFFVSNFLIKEKQNTIYENCNAVVSAAGYMSIDQISSGNTANLFSAMSSVTDADIFITDKNGKVLVCSCDDWKQNGNCAHSRATIEKSVVDKTVSENYSEAGTFNGMYEDIHFTCGVSLKDSGGEVIGAVFSSISNKNVRLFFNTILKLFFFSSLVPVLIMFFAEYYISYRYTKPLQLMAEAARSMSKGDFSKRIPVTGNDEIGELSVAFNQMTNSLVQLEGTRRRFVANVSHELKTPMTTIGGFIDGIIDGTIPKEKQEYYLNIVSGEVKRLSRLVRSMLSLSKLESGEQQVNSSRFNIFEMVCTIIVSQEQRIDERKIDIEGLDDIDDIYINADRDLIYQVIYNLIDNAVKFTDTGGKIRFDISNFENGTRFVIRNTGPGIDKKDIPYVFERFYKSDRSRSAVKDSTGLGLYIASTIISIHGGKMSVRSEKDKYTEFEFVLPHAMNTQKTKTVK